MRVTFKDANPKVYPALMEFSAYAEKSSVPPTLRHLVKVRASQINGCALCLEMHTREARHDGENETRLYLLNAWRETPYYTDSERAALELTEAVTRISEHGVSDEVYNRVRSHFSAEQYVDLIFLINVINSWNRMAISMGMHAPALTPA